MVPPSQAQSTQTAKGHKGSQAAVLEFIHSIIHPINATRPRPLVFDAFVRIYSTAKNMDINMVVQTKDNHVDSSATSVTVALRLTGLELSVSSTSSICAPRGCSVPEPFSFSFPLPLSEGLAFFPFLLLGRSHSYSGMKESTWSNQVSFLGSVRMEESGTHETNISKQLRENPNTRRRGDHGDDVKYQPYDGDSEENTDQG